MKKRLTFFALMSFLIPVLLFVGAASARMLYDDFSGTRVDDQKWMNQWTYSTELVRQVANGKLVSTVGNNTNTLIARNSVRFQNTASIHTIQCDITVNEATLDTGDTPWAFARVNGRYYNSQSSGGSTGEVWAGVHIGDRGNGLEAWWVVTETLDDNDTTWNETGSGTLAVPGLSYGTAYTVKLAYDGSKGFTFTVAGVSATFNSGPDRQRDPVNSFKGLTTGAYGFDGASGDGYVSATFDDVYINDQGTAYDTFDAALDNSLWTSFESVMELENGKLRLNQQGFDQRSQVTAYMSDADAKYVEATVRIDSDSVLSAGASGIIRIQGYFYNDRRGPGSGLDHNGYQGDVFADVRLQLYDNGSLQARAYVGRSDSADESAWSDISSHTFSTSIALDTDYRLSIQYANNQLIFKCNDEFYTYPIPTSQYPAYGEHRALTSRVYLDSGQSGYIKTQVDDVYVDGENTSEKGGFDYSAYLSVNPDLPQTWEKSECMGHYINFGFGENRAVAFNIDEYLNANPDLPSDWTLEEGLAHYNAFGKNENRLLAFDGQEYLSLYADLPQDWTYDQAYQHYLYFGQYEGRIASFDETAYLEMYPDLPGSWGQSEAFSHFLYYGQYEGRVYDPYDESVFLQGYTQPEDHIYQIGFNYLQYRTYEDPGSNQYRSYLEVLKDGYAAEVNDFTNFRVVDASGNVVAPSNTPFLYFSPFPYLFYNCSITPCALGGPYEDSGFIASFDNLPADDYQLMVDTTDGQTLTKNVHYPGKLELPVVASSSLQVDDLANGDLVLSWTNPTNAPNWSEVDNLRLILSDANRDEILYIQVNPDVETVTIPASILDQVESVSGQLIANWTMQTRALDAIYMNFARGYSFYAGE